MEVQYLRYDYKKGKFYHKEKEPKPGYVETHTEFQGKKYVSYRKHLDNPIKGTLSYLSVKDWGHGAVVSLSLKNEQDDVAYVMQTPLKDKYGNVDNRFVENLITKLPALNKGDFLEVSFYDFLPKGEEYKKRGVSIKKNGQKVSSVLRHSYFKDGKLVEGDIPPVEWKKKPFGAGSEPDKAQLIVKDEYLLKVLEKELERLGWEEREEKDPPTQTAPAQEQQQVKQDCPSFGNDDDLPF